MASQRCCETLYFGVCVSNKWHLCQYSSHQHAHFSACFTVKVDISTTKVDAFTEKVDAFTEKVDALLKSLTSGEMQLMSFSPVVRQTLYLSEGYSVISVFNNSFQFSMSQESAKKMCVFSTFRSLKFAPLGGKLYLCKQITSLAQTNTMETSYNYHIMNSLHLLIGGG